MSVYHYLVTITVGDEVRTDHGMVADLVLYTLDQEYNYGVSVHVEEKHDCEVTREREQATTDDQGRG